MNVFEYVCKINNMDMDSLFYQDEGGNIYMDCCNSNIISESIMHFDGNSHYYLLKDEYEKYAQYDIILEEDIEDVSYIRRPYYRMRGKKITQKQAFEVIRRTDNFFRIIEKINHNNDEYIGSINFDNWIIANNHYPKGYGWVHVDGTIGCNAITQKYPEIEEFVFEWLIKLIEFPYLDLIIGITKWDEYPSFFDESNDITNTMDTNTYDKEFYNALQMGIYVHDQKIEILGKYNTVKIYKEYDALYGQEYHKFESTYYDERNIIQVDLTYLKRCLESYGLDADAELAKVPSYIWERS